MSPCPAEATASGTVSLSDGQSIQSLDVVGVLQGNAAVPRFLRRVLDRGAFLLGSLAPGVYRFLDRPSRLQPGHDQQRPDRTGPDGRPRHSTSLTPLDPVANNFDVLDRELLVSILSWRNRVLNLMTGIGTDAEQIAKEYFTGPGVPAHSRRPLSWHKTRPILIPPSRTPGVHPGLPGRRLLHQDDAAQPRTPCTQTLQSDHDVEYQESAPWCQQCDPEFPDLWTTGRSRRRSDRVGRECHAELQSGDWMFVLEGSPAAGVCGISQGGATVRLPISRSRSRQWRNPPSAAVTTSDSRMAYGDPQLSDHLRRQPSPSRPISMS